MMDEEGLGFGWPVDVGQTIHIQEVLQVLRN